jgi:hypothetical protein
MSIIRPMRIRIFEDASKFGHHAQFYTVNPQTKAVDIVTEMVSTVVTEGESLPEQSAIAMDEEGLRDLGRYLVAQGLVEAPVTSKERIEHEKLQLKCEMLEDRHLEYVAMAAKTLEALQDVIKTFS